MKLNFPDVKKSNDEKDLKEQLRHGENDLKLNLHFTQAVRAVESHGL